MPIKQSPKKYLRASQRRADRNRDQKERLKTMIKEVRTLAAENKEKDARAAFQKTQKAIDKAAKTNLIKKNRAARLKSRLNTHLKKSFAK